MTYMYTNSRSADFRWKFARPLSIIALLLVWASHGYGQTALQGKVINEQQLPVAGATVIVAGSPAGRVDTTLTNPRGVFRVSPASVAPFAVRVRHLGYVTQQVVVADPAQEVVLTLSEELSLLDEVVVV